MTTQTSRKLTVGIIEDSAVKFDADGNEIVEWEIKLFGSSYPQPMRVPKDVGLRPKGTAVSLYVTQGKPKGTGNARVPEWNHWWNFAGLPPAQTPVPPAGIPTDEAPFPVAGATKAPPQTRAKAPASPSTGLPVPQQPQPPKQRPALFAKAYRYSRTFNLGQYESERLELEVDAPPDHEEWTDAEVYSQLQERIAAARATLSADASKRATERAGSPL